MFASRQTPKYKIKASGRQLPPPLAAALREIVVDRSVDMADMAILTFDNDRCAVSDNQDLQPGKPIEIELGYQEQGGQTTAVFEGEVVAVKAVFPRRGSTSVKIQAYTKHHRLQRGRFTRCFNGKTYSGIAQQIAQEVGLQPIVDPTQPAIEMVFQRNQTNLEFLLELAMRVGYEVFATEGKLFFRKPAPSGASIRKLKKGEELIAFNPRVEAALIPTEVSVRGWDPAKKEAIVGQAKKGDDGAEMNGKTRALAIAEKLNPDGKAEAPMKVAAQAFREIVVADKAAADELAKATLRNAAENLVHATASVAGSPDLKPGFVTDIDGVGDIFTGPYYIRRVVHNYLKSGYSTTLMLRKSSIEKKPEPPPQPVQAQQAPAQKAPPRHEITARVVDEKTGQPLGNIPYEVLGPGGNVVAAGQTDWQGGVQHPVEPGQHTVRVQPSGSQAAGGDQGGGGQPPEGAGQAQPGAGQAQPVPSQAQPQQAAQSQPAPAPSQAQPQQAAQSQQAPAPSQAQPQQAAQSQPAPAPSQAQPQQAADPLSAPGTRRVRNDDGSDTVYDAQGNVVGYDFATDEFIAREYGGGSRGGRGGGAGRGRHSAR
jgi:phage protein D